MKRKFSVLLITALFMVSTVFMACSNGTKDNSPASSGSSVGTGQVMGAVLDNRGEPVEGALITLGNKQVKTNSGGEFVIPDVSINDVKKVMKDSAGNAIASNVTDAAAAFTLTAKKEGYLSAKIPTVYVSYAEIETAGSAAYIADLKDLYGKYTELVKAYADAVKTAGGQNKDVTITGQTTDVVTTTTTSTSSNADTVFKPLSDAIASLKDKINAREFDKEFLSTFTVTNLIPLDASFAGTVKLNLTAKTDATTIISEKTYKPTSAPVVHATYKPTNTNANYSWDATVDENGNFKFDKCLPSGVTVSISIDSFSENINGTDYVFSSESSVLVIENSQAGTTLAATPTAIALDTINGQKSVVYMLYAQNDKIWITDTSVKDSTGAKLIDTKAPITFKFSKAMSKVDIVPSGNAASTGIKDFDEKNVTLVLSADKKTATFTPNDGNWTLAKVNNVTATKGTFKVTGEATDGATNILNAVFDAYFDTKIWISLDADKMKTFNDVDGLLALDSSIVLTFSKEMTEFVEVSLKTSTDKDIKNIYTKTWSDDMKTLTIKPDTYWDVSQDDVYKITVKSAKAADGTDEVHYWKNGLATDEKSLNVYFNDYVNAVIENATKDSKEAIRITFDKEIKSFDEKTDLTIKYQVSAGNWAAYNWYDYKAELFDIIETETVTVDDGVDENGNPKTKEETKTTTLKNRGILVSAKDGTFEKVGNYQIYFANIEAVDGSKKIREKGAYKTVISSTVPYLTTFAFDGYILKPTKIEVIDTLPATAVESRAIAVVTTKQYLKITFSKPISKSEIKIASSTAANAALADAKNYIDSADARIVYVALNDIDKVGGDLVIKLANNVTAVDGEKIITEPTSAKYEEYLGYNPSFRIYAALTLEGSSLIDAKNTASDKIKYAVADPIATGTPITFTFSDVPDTVTYTIYAYDDTVAGSTQVKAKFVAQDTITGVTTKTVSIPTAKLIPIADKAKNEANSNKFGALTTYYIDLSATKGGVTVFNTTNAYFPSTVKDTFEKEGITAIYKAGTAATTPATDLKCGTLEVKVKPISLTATNLIKGSNNSEYKKIDSLASKNAVTFDFDTDLSAYKAIYTLYGLKKVDTDNAPADNVILKEDAEATIAGNKVTIPGDLFVSKKAVGDIAKYYVELNIATAKDLKDKDTVVLYTTKTTNLGLKTNSFEAAAKSGAKSVILDAPGANATTPNTNKNYGAFIVEVAEPDVLAATSLIKKETFSLSDTAYTALDGTKPENTVAEKSAITFTLKDVDLTGCTAKYELFDLSTTTGGKAPQVISSKAATVDATAKTITVKDDLMVAGNPKVANKIFNVATADDTGISTYYLKLEVAKADGTVIFSSDTKNWWDSAADVNKDEEKDRKAYETEVAKLMSKGMFKISVAPFAVDGLSFIEEDKDTFENSKPDANGKKTYKAQKGVAPKTPITITFNSEIPVGAKYYWTLKDTANGANVDESANKKYESVTAATKTITIKSNKLLASTTAVKDYYIGLIIMNGDEKLFDTANAWFGAASDFEKAIKADAIYTDTSNKPQFIKVKVLQNQIITTKVDGVESVTTKNDDKEKGFQKTYKSPIVVQFAYPVTGYNAVLYDNSAKKYTAKENSAAFTAGAEANAGTPATKYADFIKNNAEYIYASTTTTDGKVMTITPAGFYGLNKTVKIAFFNDDGDFIDVKTDANPAAVLSYSTKTVAADYTKELLAAATTLKVETDAKEIGDGKKVVFSVPTELSAKSDQVATYTLYIKTAESTNYAVTTISEKTGNDKMNTKKNGVEGVDVTRANKILGRAETAYFEYPLGIKDFGIRGGKVSALLVKDLDGVFTAYQAELSDGAKPDGFTDVTLSSGPAAVTFTGGAGKIALTSPAPEKGTTTDPATTADITFTVKVDNGQVIKNIVAVFTSAGASTNSPAVASTCTPEVTFNSDSDVATIALKNAKYFKGDTVKFTVTDTSGNANDFIFTVE